MTELEILEGGITQYGLSYDEEKLQKLLDFSKFLLKWNKVYNLTAIKDPQEILIKHLLDSLCLAQFLVTTVRKENFDVLDVGCGGGFPSVPCSIMCPDMCFIPVDAVAKKIAFIQFVKTQLDLRNVYPLHCRVEEIQTKHFDVITSRAFSSLRLLIELTRHLLNEDGIWVALKGKNLSEIEDLPQGIVVKDIIPVKVPFLEDDRHLVILTEKR